MTRFYKGLSMNIKDNVFNININVTAGAITFILLIATTVYGLGN